MDRKIDYQINIGTPREKVFEALITPSLIRVWWSAQSAIVIPKKNGIYAVRWGEDEDHPDYITTSTILEIERPKFLKLKNESYYTKFSPLSFESKQFVSYHLTQNEKTTSLRVVHSGFPNDSSADEFYQGCVKGWKDTFAAIKQTLES